MNQKEIRSVLQDALEVEIPSAQVDLWPAIQASLVTAGPLSSQRAKRSMWQGHRIARNALVASMLAALLVVALLTPQGRVLSQAVLQFFVRTESTAFPLEPSQVVTGEPAPSAATAEPPAPLISVAEAKAQAGFSIAELPSVPEGLTYLGARLYGHAVSIEYATEGNGGHLVIMQSPEGFVQSDWDKVPVDAIVPVRIGDVEGEFAQGTFVVYAGENKATWNLNAAILRLRWQEDETWFEMTKFGNVEAIEYLDQAGLIELAGSLAP